MLARGNAVAPQTQKEVAMNRLDAKHGQTRLVACLVVALLWTLGTVSRAEAGSVLFSKLPPCIQFPGSCPAGAAVEPGAPIGGFEPGAQISPFEVSQTSLVSEIDYWSDNSSGNAGFKIWDLATAGSSPPFNLSSPLLTFNSSAGVTRTFAGIDPNGPVPIYETSILLPQPFVAVGGTPYYFQVTVGSEWIVGVGPSPTPPGTGAWLLSGAGGTPTLNGAYELVGDPVPEPASILLVGVGLVEVGRRIRLRQTGNRGQI
jgi:hypothetical protein